MTKVLVTGHQGRIGKHLVPTLLRDQYEVRGFDIKDGGDILGQSFEAALHSYRPDAIIHLAAQASVQKSVQHPHVDAMVNIIGTVRMLEVAKAAKCPIVIASSAGTIYDVKSPYGLSKKAAAEYGAMYNMLYDTQVITLGLSNVYGPGMGGVIQTFIEDEKHSRPGNPNPRGITLNGGGIEQRDFIYIDDVIRAFVNALEWAPGYYEIATGRKETIFGVFRLLTYEWGYTPKKVEAPLPPGVVVEYPDLRKGFEWEPVHLEQGLHLTVAASL